MLFAVLAWPVAVRRRATALARGSCHGRSAPCVGAISYPVGYALIARSLGGIGGLVNYFGATQQALGVMSSTLDFGGRVAYAWHMVTSVTHNWWQYSMMFGTQTSVPGAPAKTLLLTAAPIALWLAAEARRTAGIHLRVTIACGASFFLLSLFFGSRLGGHHYIALLVLGYLGLALGIAALARTRDDAPPSAAFRRGWRR